LIYKQLKLNIMKELIYRNVEFEERTKKELQISREAMQNILNEWLILEIGPCMGLNDLVLRPRAVFDRAVNNMIKVPELSGPFKMDKSKFRDTLSIPDPSALFDACKKALQLPYCAMYGIFIVNDFIVEIDKEGANELIESQNVYISTSEQKQLAADILEYIRLTNSLNEKLGLLNGIPAENQFFRGKFLITQKSFPGPYELALIPDKLREWLQG
jgi:hypothetical protein